MNQGAINPAGDVLPAISSRGDGRTLAGTLSEGSWASMAVLVTPILCAALLTKIAVPPFGADGIGISVMVIPLAIAAGILAGCMRLDAVRLALFLVVTGALGIVPLLRGEVFSVNSVLLFFAVHVPFIFSVAAGPGSARRATSFFQDLCLFLAWLGIAQFFLQFLVDARYLFPMEYFISPSALVQGFNSKGPLGYGTTLFRSNGVFLLEPSYFAQLMAIAIVVELSMLDRMRRIPVYALALLLAHSGTGLMIIAVCVPLFVISRRRWDLLFFGILIIALLFFLRHYIFLDRLLSRVDEFDSTESSGFARFVGGFYLLEEFLWNDPLRTLFGAGAGSFFAVQQRSAYAVAEMPLFKTLYEFGVAGSLAYFGFLLYLLFSRTRSLLVSLALLISFLLNGLYIPFAHGIALALFLWPDARADQFPAPAAGEPLARPVPRRAVSTIWSNRGGETRGLAL